MGEEEEEEELRSIDKWTRPSLELRKSEETWMFPTVKQIKMLLPRALSAYLCPVCAGSLI